MKCISFIVLVAFSVTSSYAAVGLEITPIRSLADDLEVVGADKRVVASNGRKGRKG